MRKVWRFGVLSYVILPQRAKNFQNVVLTIQILLTDRRTYLTTHVSVTPTLQSVARQYLTLPQSGSHKVGMRNEPCGKSIAPVH